MTKAEKRAAIDAAWAEYRRAAQALPPLAWDGFLVEDDRLWRRYVARVREINAVPAMNAA